MDVQIRIMRASFEVVNHQIGAALPISRKTTLTDLECKNMSKSIYYLNALDIDSVHFSGRSYQQRRCSAVVGEETIPSSGHSQLIKIVRLRETREGEREKVMCLRSNRILQN